MRVGTGWPGPVLTAMPTSPDPTAPAAALTGLMVLHGNRLEDLRDLLIQYVRAHPLPPLEPEVVLLQSHGMKHWLEQALADDAALGICAATRMELPATYLWQMYRAVLGAQSVPTHLPFDKMTLVWRLVRLLPQLCQQHPVYAPLKHYLGGDDSDRKRYQLALQLADVLDAYQSYRADWLTDWAAGHDVLRDAGGVAGQPLPSTQAWQAQLWRDLRSDVQALGSVALAQASRADVHARFVAALARRTADAGRPLGVPQRLVVFGVSALPMQAVQALAALGQVCQVLLLVHNPCRYYWGDVVEGYASLRAQVRRRQPVKATTLSAAAAQAAAPPLLAALGKQGRDYLHLLDGFDEPERYRAHWSRVDLFADPADSADTSSHGPSQLARLQSDIFNLNPPPPLPQPLADDGSLVFVSAHSAQREVEVLHDQLLAWLDEDASLQPRDVMVMVPDMTLFAPHIHAVFGRLDAGQPGALPYAVADVTARQSPLVLALEQLLHLPESRLSLAQWLCLFEVAAVQARFGVAPGEVQQLHAVLVAAGVRWGLDASHRVQWGVPQEVPQCAQNTWVFGLKRLLLGYALGPSAQDLWHDTLAQPAFGGLDASLAGALVQWLQAIEESLPALQCPHTPAQWCTVLHALVARFFAATNDADERAMAHLLEPLDVWQAACEQAHCQVALPLSVVREHWLSQLEQDSLRQPFFGSGVQFGTLMPMRAIPFKVICLLGMHDGAYPRAQAPRDFDLMAYSWRAGDRSRREDDRYLFLEAILSARQKLYVSWQGRNAADNSVRPASVLVAQLLDVVNACWTPAHAPQVQPLQPFSRRYFEAGSGVRTFASEWAPLWHEVPEDQGCNASENEALAEPASAPDPALEALALSQLEQLLRQPVEVFIRRRLQVELDDVQALEQEDEPFALDALQRHQAGQHLLQAGADAAGLARLRASGSLPLGAFGQQVATDLAASADVVLQAQACWFTRFPVIWPTQPIELALGGSTGPGVTLTGTLTGLRGVSKDSAAACLQLLARTGRVLGGGKTARHPLGDKVVRLWVRHLAGCAMGWPLTSVQLGVDGAVVFQPLPEPVARKLLEALLAVYAQAVRQPLPVACKSAFAYLLEEQANQARHAVGKALKDPHETAERVFDGDLSGARAERAESAYLQRAFDNYGELAQGLPVWAPALYADLLQHAQVSPLESV